MGVGFGKINRLQLLRGDFRGGTWALRPPWALAEAAFVDACTRCDDCAAACPEKIIEPGRAGFPEISFSHGECTLCEDCVQACPTDALAMRDTEGNKRAPWRIRAVVSDTCISKSGIACRVCGEHCDEDAIKFKLALGGVAEPIVDASRCTGCGACVAPCPVSAIDVTHKEPVS